MLFIMKKVKAYNKLVFFAENRDIISAHNVESYGMFSIK